MLIDLMHVIVNAASHATMWLGLPMPCWDIVADSLGVCR
jgi:hypothetical protein